MPKGVRAVSSQSRARIDMISLKYGDLVRSRETLEYQIRQEMTVRLIREEEELARLVFEALDQPDITNKELMGAIRKQNPQRWKEYLETWKHLRPEETVEDDSLIEEELLWVGMEEFKQHAPWHVGRNGEGRGFKMRNLRYPHDSPRKAERPGTDVIIYRPDHPINQESGPMATINPVWANDPNVPLEYPEIIPAIQAWIAEHPEAPQ